MVKSTAEVVIIGGGVMGASTAYHLAKRGVTDVVLVEQRYLASGPTGRSLANLRPYHGVEETVKIIHESSKIYLNFDEIIGGGGQFRNIGRVWAEPESNRALMQDMVALTGKVGMRSEYLDPAQLAEMVPGLNTEDLGSIVYFPDAGYSNPGGVTEAFAARAREQGVQVNEETKVTGIGLSGGRVQSVETDKGEHFRAGRDKCCGDLGPGYRADGGYRPPDHPDSRPGRHLPEALVHARVQTHLPRRTQRLHLQVRTRQPHQRTEHAGNPG